MPEATVTCRWCGFEAATTQTVEVGSWLFLSCPRCHKQSDVTFNQAEASRSS